MTIDRKMKFLIIPEAFCGADEYSGKVEYSVISRLNEGNDCSVNYYQIKIKIVPLISILPKTMKTKTLIVILLLCAGNTRLSAQTYNAADSLALLAIDNTCDASNNLNWNTEPDPGKWTGIAWNDENPKKVRELRVFSKSLTGTMDVKALSKLTLLDCSSNQLTGLDASTLTGLTNLSCYYNQIATLDVSELTSLTNLSCSVNQLTVLDVSNLVNLTSLACGVNQIAILDVSNLVNLTYLSCNVNQLTVLDVSSLVNLTELYCHENQIAILDVPELNILTKVTCYYNQIAILDVSELTNLTYLDCGNNQLTSLDVSALTNLTLLSCYNNQITTLNVSELINLTFLTCNANQLTVLDVSNLVNLNILICGENLLTVLDVSGLINLTRLACNVNQLTVLEVSDLVNLTYLACFDNQLIFLDVSKMTNLAELYCHSNQIISLDVSEQANLTLLSCSGNQLTSLNVSALTNLIQLYCHSNLLRSIDVTALANLSYLECYNNRLPFSSLATGLNADNFIYIPQDILFEPLSVSDNIAIDYSDEALIEGSATEFIFYKNGAEAESNTSGLYTTTGPGAYNCTMTNAKFPGLTLTTADVTVTGSTGLEVVISAGIYLYPNPVRDIVHLHFDLKQANYCSIELYNLNGILICQHFKRWMETSDHDIAIDLTHLPRGAYMMKLFSGNELFFKKLVLL